MANDAEFKEFFLRDTQVTTGAKKDQEANFPTNYLVKGISRFNRFLAGNFPSENVIRKLFNSLPFKLNQEDTATNTVQGLVKKSSDAIAEIRTPNLNSDFTVSTSPHQLPEIVLSTDGNDTVISGPVEVNGLKISILRRTVSGIFRRNYLIESVLNFKKVLVVDFVKTTNTTLQLIGATTNVFSTSIIAGKPYKFKAYLFINPDNTGGIKIGVIGTATASTILYEVTYSQDSTNTIDYKNRVATIAGTSSKVTIGNGVCIVEGTITALAGGTFGISFAQSVANGTSTILAGSYFILEEITR